MRPSSAFLAALTLLVLAGPAWAASQRDYDDCQQMVDLERRTAGCTRVINDRKESVRNRAIAYANRCGGWLLQDEPDRAMTDCDQAVRLDPKLSLGYHNRGLVWQTKGNLDRAIDDFNRALERDQKSALTFATRGAARSDKGDYDGAIADFNDAIRLGSKRALDYFGRGVAWAGKKDNDRAIADFSEAIRINPKLAEAYDRRAVAYRDKQDYARGIADVTRAMEVRGTERFEDYVTRSIMYRMSGNAAAALDDIKRAGEAYPDRRKAEYYYQSGWNLHLLGRDDEAIAAFTSAIADRPDYHWSYFRRGVSYDKKGDRAKALEDLKKAADNIDARYWSDEAKAVFAQYGLQSPTGAPIDAKILAGAYDLYNLQRLRLGTGLPAPSASFVITAGEGNTFLVRSPSDVVKPENAWEGNGTLRGKSGYYAWKFGDGKAGHTDFVVTADNDLIGYVQIIDPGRQASFNWWYLAKRRQEPAK
jgi:tetratricopeptide (TPR) repeat protein